MPPNASQPWWAIRDALAVAREVLTGKCGLIEGCIELAACGHYVVPVWHEDPDFRVFGLIASETDHLPFGNVRTRWAEAALSKADGEIAEIINANRARILTACRNIVSRFEDVELRERRTETLFRPVGPTELELIAASGWHAFPPRLPGQPIFYPVTNEAYAVQIARDWNVKESGAGFVTKFDIDADYLANFGKQTVGSSLHTEYWIPAESLDEFNRHIVGPIVVIYQFGAKQSMPASGGRKADSDI